MDWTLDGRRSQDPKMLNLSAFRSRMHDRGVIVTVRPRLMSLDQIAKIKNEVEIVQVLARPGNVEHPIAQFHVLRREQPDLVLTIQNPGLAIQTHPRRDILRRWMPVLQIDHR